MPPRLRKLALTVHVAASVGWLGAVAGFLALAVAGLVSRESRVLSAVYPAMDIEVRFVLVPLALAALGSGIVQSLGTTWGLIRHYWVVVKLAVTAVATMVLLLQLSSIRALAAAASEPEQLGTTGAEAGRLSLVVHSGGGLLVLLVPTLLSIYKPRGLTAYGWRRQRASVVRPVVGS